MPFFDTHAHLDQPEFDPDRDAVLARAAAAGVEQMLCPGISAASSDAVVRLAEQYPALFAAVGIQPNYGQEAQPGDWDQIVRLAEHPRVVAIGETGLDRHWDFTPFELQQDYFERHLELARRLNLPVIIHCREADADLMPMLRQAAAHRPLQGVMHAFSGDAAMAAECLELGLFISFAGNITYTNKKFVPFRQVSTTIAADRLLMETDCPYIVPHPLRGKEPRNEPANLIHTATALATLRNTPPADLASQTTINARRLFCKA